MKLLATLLFIASFQSNAQVSIPEDLSIISSDSPLMISEGKNYTLSLTNDVCEKKIFITKKQTQEAIYFYQVHLDRVIDQLKMLISTIPNASLESFESILPLDVQLSVDGYDGCRNEFSGGNSIILPIIPNEVELNHSLEAFQYEIGHTLAYAHKFNNEVYPEVIADIVSILLRKEFGTMGGQLQHLKSLAENFFSRYQSDSDSLASEIGVNVQLLPFLATRWSASQKCESDYFERDFRHIFTDEDLFYSGYDPHQTSCWIVSNIIANSTDPLSDLKKTLNFLLDKTSRLDFAIAKELTKIGVKIPDLNLSNAASVDMRLTFARKEDRLFLQGNQSLLDESIHSPVYLVLKKDGNVAVVYDYNPFSGLLINQKESCNNGDLTCICPDKSWEISVYAKDSSYKTQKMELAETCFAIVPE